MKLTVIRGGRDGYAEAGLAKNKPFHERLTWLDRTKKRVYVAFFLPVFDRMPFCVKLWSIHGLNALHRKYP